MLLSEEERRRFATWLHLDAEANRGLAEQMAKLNLGPLLGPLQRQKLADAEAEERVAALLESAETFTVEAGP